jgi:hypothetical protein
MTTLPKLTNKQQEILKLLYRYRFLDRIQIQNFLKHTEKRRSSRWLKDLREKHYIEWIYNANDLAEKAKPAIYYLSLNGIRYLRELDDYPPEELRKRYTEGSRQRAFIDRCLLLADCCINLEAKSVKGKEYSYELRSDYIDPDSDYHFLEELKPHACFVREEDAEETNFLFEVFDSTFPRYRLRKRLKDYINYLDRAEWEDETGDDEPPTIELAFQLKADLIYAKRRIRKLLADLYDDAIPEEIHIRFTTVKQIKEHGVTGRIWEKL